MNTVLFDLDGTLLPMDMKEFTDTYMLLLKSHLESAGYEADAVHPASDGHGDGVCRISCLLRCTDGKRLPG